MKFITIQDGHRCYYGGDQDWLPGKTRRDYGCGIIACANLVLQLQKNTDLVSKEDYLACAREIYRKLLVLPFLGLNGLSLAGSLNRLFRRGKLPYRASWGVRRAAFPVKLDEMLQKGIPVILAVGPRFPKFWSTKKVCMRGKDGTTHWTAGHYVLITEREGDRLTVSSWGREYYISLQEYLNYRREIGSFLFSNIMLIRKIED